MKNKKRGRLGRYSRSVIHYTNFIEILSLSGLILAIFVVVEGLK